MKNYLLILFLWSATIQAQIINIPDANFKAKLLQASPSEGIASDSNGTFVKIDTNLDNEIDVSEAAVIHFLSCTSASIGSISGIENFVNLEGLQCQNNNLTALPLGSLIHLQSIYCSNNQIASFVEIQNLSALTDLSIGGNPVTSINLSNFPVLWRLGANDTLLTEINLCGTSVRWLWAADNPNLTALYLKNNTVSSDLARRSDRIPPPLHNFEFYNTPLLTFICFDTGEYDAVYHGIGQNTNGKTLTTSCDNYCSLSTEDTVSAIKCSLYPNPTSTILNITLSNNQTITKTTISNLLGQTVQVFGNQNGIDVSSLNKGTYFVTVETDAGKETQRIMKE